MQLTCRSSSLMPRQEICISPESGKHIGAPPKQELYQELKTWGTVHYLDIAVAGLTSRLLASSNRSTAACKPHSAFMSTQDTLCICEHACKLITDGCQSVAHTNKCKVEAQQKRLYGTDGHIPHQPLRSHHPSQEVSPDSCQGLLAP